MRENRTYGSEGRESGNSTGLPYPYHLAAGVSRVSPQATDETLPEAALAATGAPVSVFCQVGESPAKACTLRPLAESNCVLVTRGGEQLEANEQSVD